jgi:tetratricopeptide (TPR) repeat protein
LSKQDFYPQALLRYTESYELNKALNNPLNAAFALLNRGDMLSRLGRYDEALSAMNELESYLDRLSDDSQYKQIWRAWSHVYLARMYLSQRLFAEGRSECSKALAVIAPDDHETRAEATAVQGLIEVFAGSTARGLRLCEEAVSKASSFPAQHNGSVRLALAEARLEAGDAKGALQAALEAQQILAAIHEPEHEWRAWLIAARASQQSGNPVRDHLARSSDLLKELQQMWGTDAFNAYGSRHDVQGYRKQIDALASAMLI